MVPRKAFYFWSIGFTYCYLRHLEHFTFAKLAFCFCNAKMLGLKRSDGDFRAFRNTSISPPQVVALQPVGVLMRANYSIYSISQPASNKKCLVKLAGFSYVLPGLCFKGLLPE